jgi:hypothetical protein
MAVSIIGKDAVNLSQQQAGVGSVVAISVLAYYQSSK